MKKLVFLSLIIVLFITLAVGVTTASTYGEGYEYYDGLATLPSNPLPSEQSLAEIQQMSGDIYQRYDKELRDKPGGGPGLGEQIAPLDFGVLNLLTLAFFASMPIALRKYKKKS